MALSGCLTNPQPAYACKDHWFVEIGAGENGRIVGNDSWNDGGGTGAKLNVGYQWELSPQVATTFNITHLSQWEIGKPFNKKDEDTVDHVGFSIIWRSE